MHENEIIGKIRNGQMEELEKVYVKYRIEFIRWLSSSKRISAEDSTDIYQQTIIVFYENIVNEKLKELRSGLKTYLYAIGKNKANEFQRHSSRTTEIIDNQVVLKEDQRPNEDHEEMITASKKGLEMLGNPCKTILELYYFHKRSMRQIAEQLGYKNEKSAKNQKYKCIDKLRSLVRKKVQREAY